MNRKCSRPGRRYGYVFVARDGYYNPDTEDKNLAECIVTKTSGETSMFKLGWKGEYTKFSNVEFALKEKNNGFRY